VDTSAGFSDRYIETKGSVTHSHGREGAHSHTGTAFTTWLDFNRAVEQARTVREAPARRMPEQRKTFTGNFLTLERDLRDLDVRLKAIVARDPMQPLLASHPVYQYLARRYALNLKSVMWEPDAMSPESEWQNFAELREQHPATWMLWESDLAPEIGERLQQLGIQSTVFDPCANRPVAGDFLGVMSNNLDNMARVFDQQLDKRGR
jgi:zinc transport system substrate-binding protein